MGFRCWLDTYKMVFGSSLIRIRGTNLLLIGSLLVVNCLDFQFFVACWGFGRLIFSLRSYLLKFQQTFWFWSLLLELVIRLPNLIRFALKLIILNQVFRSIFIAIKFRNHNFPLPYFPIHQFQPQALFYQTQFFKYELHFTQSC